MSKRWLKEHFSDQYVKRAKSEGYLSRASYKLLEIQEKDKILRRGMRVVDLGAAPGGWSQVAREIVGPGCVFALDILEMAPIEGVTVIQGDFCETSVLEQLLAAVGDAGIDLVMSDMAPNISGIKSVDQPRSVYLVELAFDFALQVLKPGGCFLAKVFQGAGVDELIRVARSRFTQVRIRKPDASRARSPEMYILGLGFKL